MSSSPIIKAILLMGGAGKRFDNPLPKQFVHLAGKPVYRYALDTFLAFSSLAEIVLVVPQVFWPKIPAELIDNPRLRLVEGGATRQASSYNGLIACGDQTDYVVIHDAVRPFVSRQTLAAHLNLLAHYPAINTCIPSTDTLVHVKTPSTIDTIPNRTEYWRGQTPQSFSYQTILRAHRHTSEQNASDDCSLITALGQDVHVVPGSERNLKITSPLDLVLAEQCLRTLPTALSESPRQSLAGKHFAITGGTGGIGSALAEQLKKKGAHPLIISRSAPSYAVDLTCSNAVSSLFHTLHAAHGPLDGLINCVGSLSLRPFHSLTPREIDDLISANFHALLYSCRYAHLKKGGNIVNVASSAFSRGRKSYVLYSSAKAAIVNFTQGLAEERPDLRVNAIVPKRTRTSLRLRNFPNDDPEMLLSPDEVAHNIVSLLERSDLTGILLEVRKKSGKTSI